MTTKRQFLAGVPAALFLERKVAYAELDPEHPQRLFIITQDGRKYTLVIASFELWEA